MSTVKRLNNNQKGLTLVELLIASALSLLVLVVLTNIYMSSVGLYRRQSGQLKTQADARLSLRTIGKDMSSAEDIISPLEGERGNILAIRRLKVRRVLTKPSGQNYYQANDGIVKPWSGAKEIIFIRDSGGNDVPQTGGYSVDRQNGRVTFSTSPGDSVVMADFTYDVSERYELKQGNETILEKRIFRDYDEDGNYDPSESPADESLKYVTVASSLSNTLVAESGREIFSQPLAKQYRVRMLFDDDINNYPAEYEAASLFDFSTNKERVLTIYPPASQTLNSVYAVNNYNVWAVGNAGLLIKYDNSTNTWQTINSQTSENIKSINFADTSLGWLAGQNKLIKKYSNITWSDSTVAPSSLQAFNGIWTDDLSNSLAVGGNMIYKYNTSQSIWNIEIADTASNMNSISGKGEDIFAVGNGGKIYSYIYDSSTDQQMTTRDINREFGYQNVIDWYYGTTKSYIKLAQTFKPRKDKINKLSLAFMEISSPGDNVKITVEEVNGSNQPNGNALTTTYYPDNVDTEDNGIAVIPLTQTITVNPGSTYAIVAERTGGYDYNNPDRWAWSSSSSNNYSDGKAQIYTSTSNSGSGWEDIDGDLYFQTSFEGNMWTARNEGTNDLNSVCAVKDNDQAVAVGTNGKIIRFDGSNWKSDLNLQPEKEDLFSVNAFDNEFAIAVGANGTILKYLKSDNRWQVVAYPSTDIKNLYGIALYGPNTGWIVGENGTIIKIGEY